MGKERQSNFELLRIILMMTVPVYHLCVYNGIFYGRFNANSYLGLALSCGGAIVADYAFMALSVWFFLDSRETSVWRRFFSVLVQVVIIYVIKRTTIECVFDYDADNYIVHDFFLKGAWWFVYAYMALLLIYPLLNRWIFSMALSRLRLCCILLGILLAVSGYFNISNFFSDMTAFLCTYVYIGYLKRRGNCRMLFVADKKSSQILFYVVMYGLILTAACVLRTPGVVADEGLALSVIEKLLGKYCILQFFMGIDVFLLFRNIRMGYSAIVNRIARATFTVFLLHESVLAVFWYFGRCRTELPGLPTGQFLLWTAIYLGACFIVGILVQTAYDRLCGPLIDKLTERVSARIRR